jgi:hypothetical protein
MIILYFAFSAAATVLGVLLVVRREKMSETHRANLESTMGLLGRLVAGRSTPTAVAAYGFWLAVFGVGGIVYGLVRTFS